MKGYKILEKGYKNNNLLFDQEKQIHKNRTKAILYGFCMNRKFANVFPSSLIE